MDGILAGGGAQHEGDSLAVKVSRGGEVVTVDSSDDVCSWMY